MGALVAAIPALAGSAGTALTAVSAATTVVGGLASMAQGSRQAEMAEIQSRQLELQGRMDAIRTNTELIRTLSRNNVAAATGGLQTAGSVDYAKRESMANAAEQLSIDRMNVKTQQASVEAAGKAAKTGGLFDAVGSAVTAGDMIGGALRRKKETQ